MTEKKAEEILSLVKNGYELIATDFDSTRKKEIWPAVRASVSRLVAGDRVLDLGCGNGRLLEALKKTPVDYLGVDASASLISLARQNYPDKQFIVSDLLDLQTISDEQFDYIFCLAVLQHLPGEKRREQALREMASKLKPGGEIIISNWNLWTHKKHRLKIFRNWWKKIIDRSDLDFNDLVFPWKNARGEEVCQRYYHAFTKNELRRLAQKVGLDVISLEKDDYNFWLKLKIKSYKK